MSGERLQGPHLLAQRDFKPGRVMVRMGAEDAALPLEAGTKLPLLLLLLREHLLVLPAPPPWAGARGEAPKTQRDNEEGEALLAGK